MNGPEHMSPRRKRFGTEQLTEILFESGVEAAVNAFLLLLIGSIALEIVSSIPGPMIPSPPPGFPVSAECRSVGWWNAVLDQHRFLILAGIIFIPTVWSRLLGRSAFLSETTPKTRWQKMGRRLSGGWFEFVVGNAFGAMISAMVVVWVEQFSIAQLVLQTLGGSVFPPLSEFAGWAIGPTRAQFISDWLSWFGRNQMKFTFWLLYLAAVCDDLGIPNLKTLARWGWSRIKKSKWWRDPNQRRRKY